MNNITFGQYVPGKSWIYKLDPRTKILLTIALIVLIFLIPDLIWMAAALGIFVLIILSARINVLKCPFISAFPFTVSLSAYFEGI